LLGRCERLFVSVRHPPNALGNFFQCFTTPQGVFGSRDYDDVGLLKMRKFWKVFNRKIGTIYIANIPILRMNLLTPSLTFPCLK